MKPQIITYKNTPVIVTEDWTRRTLAISGGNLPRSVIIQRPLAMSHYSIIFKIDDGSGLIRNLEFSEVTEDRTILVNAAVKFVVDGNFPSGKHFKALESLRQKESLFVDKMIKRLLRKPRKSRK